MSSLVNYLFYHTPIFYLIQSVWRDEAFSYFMAKPNILEIVKNSANDFNPPLYYILLHIWIRIIDNITWWQKLLSFLPHVFTSYIAFLLFKKITNKKFALFVFVFTFFNPMLLYYAFEIRMYSFYAFFASISFYFFYKKKWIWYLVFSLMGLFTHSFFALLIGSYFLSLFTSKSINKKTALEVLKPLVIYLLWIPILVVQFLRSKESWMFPVDLQLLKSVLGNLFTNYEGTPGNWWKYTFLLSLAILVFIYLGLRKHKKIALQFLAPIIIPLSLILGYSFVKRPIYVNRYLISITIFEIFAVSLGIWSIKNKIAKIAFAVIWFMFVIYFNLSISPYHRKTDFKTTFYEINKLANKNDYVYTKTPVGFLESAYYFKDEDRVFVYNPKDIHIPNYIGVSLLFPKISKYEFPKSPSRTFLVSDNASYEFIINN